MYKDENMQEKIKRKIIRNIVFATLFFIFTISMLTGFFIARNYVNSFEDNAKQSVKLSTSYSQIKLENIKNDTYRLTENSNLIESLDSDQYAISINPRLNFLRSQYQEEIASLILYATNDYTYKTDSISVSSILPFNIIVDGFDLTDFLNSSDNSKFFIQYDNQIISYFSFLHKIQHEGRTLGYLLINLKPTYLLTNYYSYQNNSSLDLINQYIIVNNQKLYFINKNDSPLNQEVGFTNLKTYVISDDFYEESLPFFTIASTESLIQHILELTLVIIVIDTILIIFAYFMAKRLGISISQRFEDLKRKMISATESIK